MDPQKLLAESQALLQHYRERMNRLSGTVARARGNLAVLEERRAEAQTRQVQQVVSQPGGRRKVLRKKRKS